MAAAPWAMNNYLGWRGLARKDGHPPHRADRCNTPRRPVAQAPMNLLLGQISAGSGDYDGAREHLLDSLASYQELGDFRGEAQFHIILHTSRISKTDAAERLSSPNNPRRFTAPRKLPLAGRGTQ
jgi:hypothetical protein